MTIGHGYNGILVWQAWLTRAEYLMGMYTARLTRIEYLVGIISLQSFFASVAVVSCLGLVSC